MKKMMIIILIVCVLLSASSAFAISQGSDEGTIVGLQEKMDNLWLVNHFTQEQMDDMLQQSIDGFIRDFWSMPWEQRQMVEWRGIKYDTPEEELAYRLSNYHPDLTRGLLVTYMNIDTMKYFNAYAQSGNFSYLFSNETSFQANAGYYTLDGQYIDMSLRTRGGVSLDQEELDFLKNIGGISEMLREAGETVVNDVKLLGGTVAPLYLNCGNREYLVRLEGGPKAVFPDLLPYKLYPAGEATQIIANIALNYDAATDGWVAGITQAQQVAAEKPTFQAEAEALQDAGLLNGNEKGLDLLKPLTRIEAAAMLLRALGEPETPPEGGDQIFTDVPTSHWGFGAASQAYNLGLIKGVGDSKFAPNKIVAANEFATMTLRAANETDFNWEQALEVLIEQGIITQENAATMDLFTRGDMAKIIYEARQKGLL